ncbi:MAG: hypothetical protein JSW47_07365 [Phycisphaerales bacterium]|nr:MAG: hypothetical protein JSW47_07365 [Phycisphaerales bacterium]
MKDMEELLEQTEGTGVDVYTHGEMLPANYYPAFKKIRPFCVQLRECMATSARRFRHFSRSPLSTSW